MWVVAREAMAWEAMAWAGVWVVLVWGRCGWSVVWQSKAFSYGFALV